MVANNEKDQGVRAWADLVLHFETSSKDLRVENLTKKWDDAMLQAGEYPDRLWTKLTSINQNLGSSGKNSKTVISVQVGATRHNQRSPEAGTWTIGFLAY